MPRVRTRPAGRATEGTAKPRSVGLLREGSLHAALKERYAGPEGVTEALVDGFVVDVLLPDGIVEIQTGSFASARQKLARLVERHAVRIVYPVVAERWIVRVDEHGSVVGRRRSPLRPAPHAVFHELVPGARLVAHPNFTLELAFTVEEELRAPLPPERRRWPRTWRRVDRRLLDIVGTRVVAGPEDLPDLVPGGLPARFTARDLAAAFGRRRRLGQRAAYCLRLAGATEVVGREGNAVVYEPARTPPVCAPS